MQPIEIIAIMRSKGWLNTEPRNTRERVTSATRYMMVKTGTSNIQLAHKLSGVSDSYIRRKLSEHRWRMEDLDELPQVFGRDTADFVQGYQRMADIDEEENSLSTPEEPHDE